MKHQDSLAALLFHAIITFIVWVKFEGTAATIYAAIAVLTTIIVHYSIFVEVFSRFWPKNYYKDDTSLPRPITDTVIAIANILLSAVFLWLAMFIDLVGNAFNAYATVMHDSAINGYEGMKPVTPGAVEPEINDGFSTGLFYIADQFASVLNVPVVTFTILSIVAILVIEFLIYLLYLKCAGEGIREKIRFWV